MRTHWAAIKRFLFVFVIGVASCAATDPSVGSCAPIIRELQEPGAIRRVREEFSAYDFEVQYQIFICDRQAGRPALDFGPEFARQGRPAGVLLRDKLLETDFDGTVMDIAYVYSLMAVLGTYDVAGEADTMRLLDQKISAISDAGMRNSARASYDAIRASAFDDAESAP